jgi:hypothetical protein
MFVGQHPLANLSDVIGNFLTKWFKVSEVIGNFLTKWFKVSESIGKFLFEIPKMVSATLGEKRTCMQEGCVIT